MAEGERVCRTMLDEMAPLFVGDGNTPNLFFVTENGKVTAVFAMFEDAENFVHSMSCRSSAIMIEDRLEGVVWMNAYAEAMARTKEHECTE